MINDASHDMQQACKAFKEKMASLQAGRAHPAILENFEVEIYGTRMPLSRAGTVSASGSQMLVVSLWDMQSVSHVTKVLQSHGFTPQTEGQILRVPLPPLTQERRKELIKIAKDHKENTIMGLRTIRRKYLSENKKPKELSEDEEFAYKKQLDDLTKKYEKELDALFKKKEEEIALP